MGQGVLDCLCHSLCLFPGMHPAGKLIAPANRIQDRPAFNPLYGNKSFSFQRSRRLVKCIADRCLLIPVFRQFLFLHPQHDPAV